MEIADLKTLVSVVEHGSITNAAKALNRVPSGVTARILQLEDSLGVQLFLREKKRLLVTDKGKDLCNYARKVIDLLGEAERRMRGKEPGGTLRIGAVETTLASRLTEPLSRLHAQYRELDLQLTTGTGRELYESLLANQLDVAFISDPPTDERIEQTVAFDEKLVFISSGVIASIQDPSDIANMTILAFKDGCSYRNRLIRWFEAYGMAPERIADMSSYHTIMGAVAAGMGVGVMPASVVELFPQKETIAVHPFTHPLAKAPTSAIWRKRMASPNISALLSCLDISPSQGIFSTSPI